MMKYPVPMFPKSKWQSIVRVVKYQLKSLCCCWMLPLNTEWNRLLHISIVSKKINALTLLPLLISCIMQLMCWGSN